MPRNPAGSPTRPAVGASVPVNVAPRTWYAAKLQSPVDASPAAVQFTLPDPSVVNAPGPMENDPPPSTLTFRPVTVKARSVSIGKSGDRAPGPVRLVTLKVLNDASPSNDSKPI